MDTKKLEALADDCEKALAEGKQRHDLRYGGQIGLWVNAILRERGWPEGTFSYRYGHSTILIDPTKVRSPLHNYIEAIGAE